jgi:hypothetical protein
VCVLSINTMACMEHGAWSMEHDGKKNIVPGYIRDDYDYRGTGSSILLYRHV